MLSAGIVRKLPTRRLKEKLWQMCGMMQSLGGVSVAVQLSQLKIESHRAEMVVTMLELPGDRPAIM